MNAELVERILELERRLDNLDRPERGIVRSTLNVSNPPTDAELDAEFGAPADFYDVILINDNDADANWWLVVSDGGSWVYEAMTQAV